MTDDIEGEGLESTEGTTPPSEPSSDPASDLTSEIRKSIDTQRERGPDGKFVASDKSGGDRGAGKGTATGAAPDKPPARAVDKSAGRAAEGVVAEAAKPAVGAHPPPGFSVGSKQLWDTLPEPVKADIAKRESEIDSGMRRYGGLANFAQEAERNGTTLQNAVSDFVAVETELRKDPVSGVEFMFRKMGLNPLGVLKAWLSRYVPAQGGQAQPSQQQTSPQIDPNAIANHAANMIRQEWEMKTINNDIASFSADPANKFFPNVRPVMARLVAADESLNLKTAYEAACWMHPEIRAILIEEAAGGQNKVATRTAARAQNAAKAVTGAPSSNSHDAPKKRDLSLDEEIRANIAAQRGNA